MKTIKIPPSKCPVCGYVMDNASCMSDDKQLVPSPGDFSVCMKCGEVEVFDDDLHTREATINDMMGVPTEKFIQISRLQEKIRKERPLG